MHKPSARSNPSIGGGQKDAWMSLAAHDGGCLIRCFLVVVLFLIIPCGCRNDTPHAPVRSNDTPHAGILTPEETDIADIAKAEVARREKGNEMEAVSIEKIDGNWWVHVQAAPKIVSGEKVHTIGDDRFVVISPQKKVLDYHLGH